MAIPYRLLTAGFGVLANVAGPAILWSPGHVKASKPFATSMWARLPWRRAAGGLALGTGTPQGVAFGLANADWAIGDVAIGSLD
jgi:hypothetical protein